MCGRYLLRNAPEGSVHTPWTQFWENLQLEFEGPRYNICPGQRAWVALGPTPTLAQLSWGFKPGWSNFAPQINARAETVFTSKMFRQAARAHRCLVWADGFYEPRGAKTHKNRPWYLFEYEDRRRFAIAGLYTDDGFTLITCAPNAQVEPIHERMPVIVPECEWGLWLDARSSEAALAALLAPKPYPGLAFRPVGDRVKRPGAEGPECIAPPADSLF